MNQQIKKQEKLIIKWNQDDYKKLNGIVKCVKNNVEMKIGLNVIDNQKDIEEWLNYNHLILKNIKINSLINFYINFYKYLNLNIVIVKLKQIMFIMNIFKIKIMYIWIVQDWIH